MENTRKAANMAVIKQRLEDNTAKASKRFNDGMARVTEQFQADRAAAQQRFNNDMAWKTLQFQADVAAAQQRFNNDMACTSVQFQADRAAAQQRFRNDMAVVASGSDDNHTKGLLDLCGELRNAIYKLCLTTTQEIPITTYHERKGCYIGRPRTQIWLCPNLLATCKTVHNEATSVLYGSNHFVLPFLRDPIPSLWTEDIGDSVKHLRAVSICGASNKQAVIRDLQNLNLAHSLDVLVVKHSCWENFRTAKTMANGLCKFIMQLHQSRRNTDKKAAMDVLKFEEPRYPMGYNPPMGLTARFNAETAEVRGCLSGKLKKLDMLEELEWRR